MNKTVVYTVGRFNPPTTGHELLIKTVEKTARKEGGDAYVFATTSHDSKKNPLKFEQKIYFLKKAFPRVKFNTDKKLNNAFTALGELVKKYDHIVFIVGGDRVAEFTDKLEGFFVRSILPDHPQKTIEILSAGERDAIKVGGINISGTAMRNFVKANDFDSFSKGVVSTLPSREVEKLFTAVKAGMGLTK